MKIARIESFILGTGSSKDLLLCRVETADGTYGWGEAYVTHRGAGGGSERSGDTAPSRGADANVCEI